MTMNRISSSLRASLGMFPLHPFPVLLTEQCQGSMFCDITTVTVSVNETPFSSYAVQALAS